MGATSVTGIVDVQSIIKASILHNYYDALHVGRPRRQLQLKGGNEFKANRRSFERIHGGNKLIKEMDSREKEMEIPGNINASKRELEKYSAIENALKDMGLANNTDTLQNLHCNSETSIIRFNGRIRSVNRWNPHHNERYTSFGSYI